MTNKQCKFCNSELALLSYCCPICNSKVCKNCRDSMEEELCHEWVWNVSFTFNTNSELTQFLETLPEKYKKIPLTVKNIAKKTHKNENIVWEKSTIPSNAIPIHE